MAVMDYEEALQAIQQKGDEIGEKPGGAWWNQQLGRWAQSNPEGAKKAGIRAAGPKPQQPPGDAGGAVSTQDAGGGDEQGLVAGLVRGAEQTGIGHTLYRWGTGQDEPPEIEQWQPKGYMSRFGHMVGETLPELGAAGALTLGGAPGLVAGGLGWVGVGAFDAALREKQRQDEAWKAKLRAEGYPTEPQVDEKGQPATDERGTPIQPPPQTNRDLIKIIEAGGEAGLENAATLLTGHYAGKLGGKILGAAGRWAKPGAQAILERVGGIAGRLTGYGAGGAVSHAVTEEATGQHPGSTTGQRVGRILEAAKEGAAQGLTLGAPLELMHLPAESREIGKLRTKIAADRIVEAAKKSTANNETGTQRAGAGEGGTDPDEGAASTGITQEQPTDMVTLVGPDKQKLSVPRADAEAMVKMNKGFSIEAAPPPTQTNATPQNVTAEQQMGQGEGAPKATPAAPSPPPSTAWAKLPSLDAAVDFSRKSGWFTYIRDQVAGQPAGPLGEAARPGRSIEDVAKELGLHPAEVRAIVQAPEQAPVTPTAQPPPAGGAVPPSGAAAGGVPPAAASRLDRLSAAADAAQRRAAVIAAEQQGMKPDKIATTTGIPIAEVQATLRDYYARQAQPPPTEAAPPAEAAPTDVTPGVQPLPGGGKVSGQLAGGGIEGVPPETGAAQQPPVAVPGPIGGGGITAPPTEAAAPEAPAGAEQPGLDTPPTLDNLPDPLRNQIGLAWDNALKKRGTLDPQIQDEIEGTAATIHDLLANPGDPATTGWQLDKAVKLLEDLPNVPPDVARVLLQEQDAAVLPDDPQGRAAAQRLIDRYHGNAKLIPGMANGEGESHLALYQGDGGLYLYDQDMVSPEQITDAEARGTIDDLLQPRELGPEATPAAGPAGAVAGQPPVAAQTPTGQPPPPEAPTPPEAAAAPPGAEAAPEAAPPAPEAPAAPQAPAAAPPAAAPGPPPTIVDLLTAARAAMEAGQHDQADALLNQAEALRQQQAGPAAAPAAAAPAAAEPTPPPTGEQPSALGQAAERHAGARAGMRQEIEAALKEQDGTTREEKLGNLYEDLRKAQRGATDPELAAGLGEVATEIESMMREEAGQPAAAERPAAKPETPLAELAVKKKPGRPKKAAAPPEPIYKGGPPPEPIHLTPEERERRARELTGRPPVGEAPRLVTTREAAAGPPERKPIPERLAAWKEKRAAAREGKKAPEIAAKAAEPKPEAPPAPAEGEPSAEDQARLDRVRKRAQAATTPEDKRAAYQEYRDQVVQWQRENRVSKAWATKELQTIRSEMEATGVSAAPETAPLEEGKKILPRNVRTAEERAAAPERAPVKKGLEQRIRAWIDEMAPPAPDESVEQQLNRLHDLDQKLDARVNSGEWKAESVADAKQVLRQMVNELRGRTRAERVGGVKEAPPTRGAAARPLGAAEAAEEPISYTNSHKLHDDMRGRFVRYRMPNGRTGIGEIVKWNRNLVGVQGEGPKPTWVRPQDVTHVLTEDKPRAPGAVTIEAKPGPKAAPESAQPAGAKAILGKAKVSLRTKEGEGMADQIAALRKMQGEENLSESTGPPGEVRPPKGRR